MQTRYHSFELEMLAVVKSIERFHIYLYGIQFTVITDCHALVYAINKAHLNPRITRWTLRLQPYSFSISHRPGTKMAHVDALSRIVSLVTSLPLERELEFRQLKDPIIKEIVLDLESPDNEKSAEKFEIIDGLVFRKEPDKSRFYVPVQMINNVIRIYHDNMAHCGAEKTIRGILENYWFPSLRKKVNMYIENCITCLLANSCSNSREGEMQLTESPSSPFSIIQMDHFGPISETE